MNKIKLLGASLLLFAVTTSCLDDFDEMTPKRNDDTVPLTLYLQTADQQYATRAYEGDVTAESTAESTIHDAKVWIYDASTKEFLAFGKSDGNTVTLDLPVYIITSKSNIDVYAIGNSKSVWLGDLNAASGATIGNLTSYILGGTNFVPPYTSSVRKQIPDEGLPMSCIEQNYNILNEEQTGIAEELPTIMMTRAVSKVRFAFGRTTGYDDLAITGIEIDEDLIPVKEYIFPIAKSVNPDNYATIAGKGTYRGDRYPNIVTEGDHAYIAGNIVYRTNDDTDFSTTLIPSLNIHTYDDPRTVIWPAAAVNNNNPMTAQQYSSYVTTDIINNKYNFTTYLRETNKPISGTIHYTVAGVKKSTPFTMATDNDFARNHEWIVYGYFDPAKLTLTVTVQPWELVEKEMDYQNNITVVTSMNWTNWNELQSNYANQSLVFKSTGDDKTIYGTFEIGTPKGFNWTASFTTIAGSNTAFMFLDENNTPVSSISGEIGKPSILKVVVSNPNATIDSEAVLSVVVPIEGRYRPVTEFEGWHFTQRGSQ